ncbi:MAG: ABC-2 transporter permease [Coprobacillus sp.]
MKGIIYKDFLSFLQPKHAMSILADVVVTIPIICIFQNIYGLALTCIMLLPMTGTSLLQVSMEQDELSNFDKFQLTLPLTKKQIILSKYVAGLLFMGIFAVISLLLSLIYFYGVLAVADLMVCLQIWLLGVIAGCAFLSITYVGFLLLGNKKGTIVYFILAAISVVAYLVGYFSFDAMAIFNINHNVLLLIGAIITVVLLTISYYLSVKIYTKRYS